MSSPPSRLAQRLAGHAVSWEELLAAVDASRDDDGPRMNGRPRGCTIAQSSASALTIGMPRCGPTSSTSCPAGRGGQPGAVRRVARPAPATTGIRARPVRLVRRLRSGLAAPRRRDGVTVLSPLVLPLIPTARSGCSPVRARRQVGAAARRLGMRRPILWAYVPQAEALLSLNPRSSSITVWTTSRLRTGSTRQLDQAETVLRGASRLCWPVRRPWLSGCALSTTSLAPNVADTALFATRWTGTSGSRPRGLAGAADHVRRRDRGPEGRPGARRRHRDRAAGVVVVLVGPVGPVIGHRCLGPGAIAQGRSARPTSRAGLPSVLRAADAGLIL